MAEAKAHFQYQLMQDDYSIRLMVRGSDGRLAGLSSMTFEFQEDAHYDSPEIRPGGIIYGIKNQQVIQAIVDAAAQVGIVARDSSGELAATKDHLRDMKAVGEAFSAHLRETIRVLAQRRGGDE